MHTYNKRFRFIAVFLALNILVESVAPYTAFALTSGPTQPEFTSFEPVATTNMVDPFTGGFTYNLPVINIPGPNGGGYGVSLSYHSGSTMEDEASWVGYGWTLNPGAINRNKSGFPDDVNGGQIRYKKTIPKVYSVSSGTRIGLEIFGGEGSRSTSISASQSRTFNSNKGFGRTTSIGVAPFGGIVSLGFSVTDGTSSFSAEVSPAAILALMNKRADKKSTDNKYKNTLSMINGISKRLSKMAGQNKINELSIANYGIQCLYEVERPTTIEEYTAFSIAIDVSLGASPAPIPVGIEGGVYGSYVWQNSRKEPKKAYGSMHLSNGINKPDAQLDYFVEKESYYNKRDLMLGLPYHGTDVYAVMGEGIGGGFKYKHNNVGHYAPTPLKNKTILVNGSVEISLGTDMKPATGIGLGVGVHTLRSNPIDGQSNQSNHGLYTFNFNPAATITDREKGHFRFTGDLSNSVSYSTNYDDDYVSANVGMTTFNKYTKINENRILKEQETVSGETQRSYRSSYVGYTTFSDFNMPETNKYLRSYTRDIYTRDLVFKSIPDNYIDPTDTDPNGGVIRNQIAEMYAVSADGNTYVYGLPVFSYQEKSVALGLDVVAGNHVSMESADILNSTLNGGRIQKGDFEIEELHDYPYVTNHLLTQIVTPDYIDRTFDGPTADDFGGWTKFNYAPGQPYASNSTRTTDYRNSANWYAWRTPYTGHEYDRGSLSMVNDDMLQHNEGLKQQYFLESIETKTHIAYFVTNTTNKTITNESGQSIRIRGSLTARIDGVSAAIGTGQAAPSQTNRKLERVILFAKSDLSTATSTVVNGKPLKIANLEYYGYPANASTLQAATDKSKALCHNIPNRLINTTDNPFDQNGKLTLKRIWFEYEGVVNAKISPYEFYYEYKNNWSLPAAIATKYTTVTGYGSSYTSAEQNPTYNPLNKDGWGNYTNEGLERAQKMNNTVSQIPLATFDPAAWQLKRIVLPSGGELLVQYEQADYKYVHNQNAMVLTKLIDPVNSATTTKTDGGTNTDQYFIDLASIGITSPADITSAETLIRNYLKENKLYFKFLYSLNGSSANIKDCNVEYITGYAKAEVTKDIPTGKLFITFPAANPNVTENYTVPRKVCEDFFLKERKGLELTANCNNVKRIPIAAAIENNRAGAMPALMQVIAAPNESYPDHCQTLSLENSYVRIPVLYGKKGGGIRVKRVMMYDPGLETGDQMLYGSEYIYKLADNKTSSGVATNEPQAIREENVLIGFLQKRSPQKWIQKITSGKDKEQFEGPIGESLLPGPSIGYSRVVVKNIHTGKTNTGFTVNEFYTAFDHPIAKWRGDESSVNIGSSKKRFFPGIFVSVNIDKRYSSQGYAFVLYDIHGKPKRVATYQGDYDVASAVNPELTSYMSYQESYEYTKPGEKVNVLDYNGNIRSIPIGRDEEIAMEMRSVSDITDDFSVKFDAAIGYAVLPIPTLTLWPSLGDDEKEMNTHVTNKVIRYTPVLKKTTVFKDGVVHVTENKVFSISNGSPVVTVTYDGYNDLNLEQDPAHKGAYVNYSVPADYIYKALSGKFKNEKLTYALSGTITNVDPANGKYKISIGQSAFDKGYCATGDLLRIEGSSTAYCYVIDLVKQGATYDMVIQMLPGTTLAGSMISSVQNFTCYVIHSGFSNQLNGSVASVTTYGDNPSSIISPVIFGSGQRKLRAFTNAVNASVQTFKGTRAYNSSIDAAYNLPVGYNEFLAGRAGKWRPFESYTQKKAIAPASTTGTSRIYTAGTFASDVFDYDPAATNALWTKTNTVTLYSPDGNPLEEKNILNIYSAAKFGYGSTVPVLVAKNSQYTTSYFDGFEEYPDQISTMAVTRTSAHTGSRSLLIPSGSYVSLNSYVNGQVSLFNLAVTDQMVNKGILTRMWVKISDEMYSKGISNNLEVACYLPSDNTPNAVFALTEIARVGEWSLIEGVIPKGKTAAGQSGGGYNIRITNKGGDVYVDDIRVQPYDAEMACYVYDPKNLRLLASFDDQHFAMIYQYNAEGKLLRKLVETEKGIKTIVESQFNTPQKAY